MGKELFSERSQLKRSAKRGNYDKEAILEILDASFLCHVACNMGDSPVIIPTCYGRINDVLYLHGATSNRILSLIASGSPTCIEVTLMDGLVLARSAFHHSMNYRSVVLFGKGYPVTDNKEAIDALKAITDNIIPNRWKEVREPSEVEMKGTLVIGFPINEGSSKVRTGPPVDSKEDYKLNIWAGEIPLRISADQAIPDPLDKQNLDIPASVHQFINQNK